MAIYKKGYLHWKDLVHPNDIFETLSFWEVSLKTGVDFNVEHRLKLKNETYNWHCSQAHIEIDISDNILKWYGTSTDIHEQKLKEQKKDEFISIASHEMKTPLTTAKAYLQMLEMELEGHTDEAKHYVSKANLSVNTDCRTLYRNCLT